MPDKQMPDLTIREYVERLAGDDPAPGGGSAAALAGALAAASARMVGSFTVGREKYADVEDQIREHLTAIDELRAEMLELVQQDVEAFRAVGEAYAMPRNTEDERRARSEAIQEALMQAADVPLRLARACERLSGHLPLLLKNGNQNLVSDVGVAAKLCEAACECAWLNVEVNLAHIRDAAFIEPARAEVEDLLAGVRCTCQEVWEETAASIRSE
ncbi:MAG: cyclodeaminase/cyclohydrolase family protein [Armatimonadota bacterium]